MQDSNFNPRESDFTQGLKKQAESPESLLLDVNTTLRFRYHPDKDFVIIHDEFGFVITQDDFEELVSLAYKAFDTIPGKVFGDHNEEKWNSIDPTRGGTVRVPKRGVVYFIKMLDGVTKIGQTGNLEQRLKFYDWKLGSGSYTLLHTIKSSDVEWAETYFHTYFSSRKVKGELFRLLDEEIEWARSLKELEPTE